MSSRIRVTVLDAGEYGTFVYFPTYQKVRFYRYGHTHADYVWDLLPSRQSHEGALLLACRQLPYIIDGNQMI